MTPTERKKHNLARFLESVETTETIEHEIIDNNNSSDGAIKEDIATVPIGDIKNKKIRLFHNLDYQRIATIATAIVSILTVVGYFIYLHVQTSVNSNNIQNVKDDIKEIKEVNIKQDSLIIDILKRK